MKTSYTEPGDGKFKLILDRMITLEEGIEELTGYHKEVVDTLAELKGRITKYLNDCGVPTDNKTNQGE